jgi:hypothetical protein
MPTSDDLFAASKKVFAHYFSPFPLSLDNLAPADDYYNMNYLSKNGEGNKWISEGGFLRARPLGTGRNSSPGWRQLNMEAEVRSAIARGITGFTFDVMAATEATESDGSLGLMLAAAQAVDSRFKIVVMPDIAVLGSDSKSVEDIIAAAAKSPAAYRLSDGRLVASAFDAGLNSAAWWAAALEDLNNRGIKVAFVPTFLGWTNYADAFASISYGFGDWGGASVGAVTESDSEIIHKTYGKISMMPVDPQQSRPKDFLYVEAGNSEAFRNAWSSSISGGADWIQLVTWNDFSETSQVSPYTDSTLQRDLGTGYYNLNGYYAQWFLTGKEPVITHDVLYYFYRREPSSSAAPAQSKKDEVSGRSAMNEIELLAFLTDPGELKITIGGHTYTQDAAAGVVSFKIPMQAGQPVFTLSRGGTDVFSFQGGVTIYGLSGLPSGVNDYTYWSGSAAKSGICGL